MKKNSDLKLYSLKKKKRSRRPHGDLIENVKVLSNFDSITHDNFFTLELR